MKPYNTLKNKNLRKRFQQDQLRSGNDYIDPCDSCNRFCKCRKLDFLGEPVNFNFKGQENYESTLGAFCSILVTIVIIAYVSNGVLHLYFQTPRSISQLTYLNPYDSTQLEPFDLGYEFAIGFVEGSTHGNYMK